MHFKGIFGRGCFVMHLTPVEPMLQKAVHHCYIDWKLPTLLGKFYMLSEAIQVHNRINMCSAWMIHYASTVPTITPELLIYAF